MENRTILVLDRDATSHLIKTLKKCKAKDETSVLLSKQIVAQINDELNKQHFKSVITHLERLAKEIKQKLDNLENSKYKDTQILIIEKKFDQYKFIHNELNTLRILENFVFE